MAFNAGEIVTKFKGDNTDFKQKASETKKVGQDSSNGIAKGFLKAQVALQAFNAVVGIAQQGFQRLATFMGNASNAAKDQEKALLALELYGKNVMKLADDQIPELSNRARQLGEDLGIGVTGSAEALQRLLKSGLNLDQATELMQRFTNEAITGKAANMELGDAVQNLAMMYQTEMSTLGDRAGISENMSSLLEKQAEKEGLVLSQLEASQREQLKYRAFIELTNETMGSSEIIMQTLSGSQTKYNTILNKTSVAVGQTINPLLRELYDNILIPMAGWILNNIVPAFQSFIANALPAGRITEILGGLRDRVKALYDRLQPLVTFMQNNWQPILFGIGTALAVVVVPALWSAVSALAAMAASAITALAPFALLAAAGALLYKAYQNNWLGIRDIVDNVVSWFTGTALPEIQKFFGGLRERFEQLVNSPAVQAFITIIRDSLTNAINNLRNGFEQFRPKLEELANKFGEFWTKIQPLVTVLREGLKYAIIGIGIVFAGLVVGVFKLIEVLSAVLFPVIGFLADVFMFALDVIGNLVQFIANEVVPRMVTAFQNIGNWLSWLWNSVAKPVITFIGSAFLFLINNVIRLVVGFFTAAIKTIASILGWVWNNVISPILTLISAIFARVFYEIYKVIQARLQAAWSIISGIFNAVKRFVSGAVNFLRSVVSSAFNFIRDRMSQPIQDASNRIRSIFDSIRDFISGALDRIKSTISNIAGSITSALTKPFNDAKEKIENIASGIKDAAAKISPFHKSSPSLVEYVQMGIGKITDEYKKLGDLTFESVAKIDPAVRGGEGGLLVDQGAMDNVESVVERRETTTERETDRGITIEVDKYYGDSLGLRGLAEAIKKEFQRMEDAGTVDKLNMNKA